MVLMILVTRRKMVRDVHVSARTVSLFRLTIYLPDHSTAVLVSSSWFTSKRIRPIIRSPISPDSDTGMGRQAFLHVGILILAACCSKISSNSAYAFVPSRRPGPVDLVVLSKTNTVKPHAARAAVLRLPRINGMHVSSSNALKMSSSDEGPGILTKIGLAGVLLVFLATSILPFLSDMGGGSADLSAAVVTRQQNSNDPYKNYESQFDRLSRAKIQEKLSRVPAFYLVDKVSGRMSSDIFMSYEDAVDASKAGDGYSIKATTLNQVMYPLVLQRGRMMMPPAPEEVTKAEDELRTSAEDGVATIKFRLVPSKPALKAAADAQLVLGESDIPLFVADRLAFAGANGAQVPLFLEKEDALTSYDRLKESSSKLPSVANIRTTTLLDELNSMEKGNRPGVKQLEFYAAADDLMRADAML